MKHSRTPNFSGRALRAFFPLGALVLAACGGDDTPPPFDAGPVYPRATTSPQVAFEGQGRLVVDLYAAGQDFTGGSVRAEDPAGPLDVLEQRCRGERCAVVLRVRDTRPNMGIPVPSPIDAEQHGLIIMGGTEDHLANLTVFPLDTIDNGGTTAVSVRGVVMAASAETGPGSIFEGTAGAEPIRWVIFGDATFAGTVDVSGAGAEGRAGGAAGGAAGAPGEDVAGGAGPTGGAPGVGGAGAGGGAAGADGEAGAGADGTALAGGAGGMGASQALTCASRLEEASCGGAGGGGAAGEGGAGGGTLLIASLGTLRATGASFSADGAAGADAGGGGGGGGGNLLLAAPTIEGAPTVSATAGAGGTSTAAGIGGTGADGRVRVDAFVSSIGGVDAGAIGPAIDVASVQSISDSAAVTLTGHAAPGAAIEARILDAGGTFSATADATDGTFTIDVTLRPGINRITVSATVDGVTERSWVGTNFELENIPALSRALPRGATIDIVHLP